MGTTVNAIGGITQCGGGALTVTKAGGGTWALSGASTYTGGTTINAGILQVQGTETPGTSGPLGASSTITFGGGTLQYSSTNAFDYSSRFSTASQPISVDTNGRSVTWASNLMSGTAGSVTKLGSGSLTLSGTNTYTGNTTVSSAAGLTSTLNITGTLTGNQTTSTLNYGTTAGNSVVNVSNRHHALHDQGRVGSGGRGDLQSNRGQREHRGQHHVWHPCRLGNHGRLRLHEPHRWHLPPQVPGTPGGSRFTVTNNGVGSVLTQATTNTGVVYVGGTGFIDQTNAEWWLNYGLGQITVADSGKIDRTGATQYMGIVMDSAFVGGSYGVLNIAGTGAQVITGALPLRFGNSTVNGSGNSAFVNLAAGTLNTATIGSTSFPAAPSAINNIYYNYAGGTVKASAALTAGGWAPASIASVVTVINTLYGPINNNAGSLAGSGAPSFNGGLTVDTNGFAVTLPSTHALLGATGNGVTQLDLTVNGGAGYVGAPAVIFSKPASATGVPATGYALISSGGVLTGIVITNPGVYAASETPTVTLVGGGASTPATVTSGALGTPNVSGGLTKIGSGTLTLSATNTYTGGTTVTGGTVALGANNTLASTGNVTVNGGIFDVATFNNTVGTVSLQSGSIAGTTGILTSTNYDLRSGPVTAILAGANGTSGFVKSTGGTVTLSGANTFTGTVNVNGGTLAFATDGNLGNTANPIGFNGGTLSYTGSGSLVFPAGRVVTIGAGGGTLNLPNAGTLTLTGGISGASTGNLTKIGSGSVIVPGSVNLNGGSVTVGEGTLRAGFGTAGISALTVSSTGYLDMTNGVAQALTLGGTTGALTLDGGARLLFELGTAGTPGVSDSLIVPSGGTAITSGNITLNFFNLSGFGAGTYDLLAAPAGLLGATYELGTAPSGFNYSINVTDMLVSLGVVSYVPIYWTGSQATTSWATTNAGPLTNWSTNAAGTLNYTTLPTTTDTVIFSATNATGGAISTTLDGSYTLDGLQFINAPTIPATTTVTIAQGSSGSLIIQPSSASGGIVVAANGGDVTISAPVVASNVSQASQVWNVDGTGTSSLTISGNTTFTANVTKTGAGTLTLSGTSNSGTGNFTLAAGPLNLNTNGVLGTGTFIVGAGTTINNTGGGTVTLTNAAHTWNGGFTYTGGTRDLNLGTGPVSMVLNNSVTVSANTLTVGGAIGDGGNTRALTKAGTGTLALNGNNTYDGLTTVSAGILTLAGDNSGAVGGVTLTGGTLNINSTNALGTGLFTIGAGTVINNTSGVAVNNTTNNNLQTWNGSFTFTGGSNLNLGSGTVTLGVSPTITVSANTLTVGGVIDDGINTFNLTKNGPGRLTLTGLSSTAANNFSGNLVLDGGITDINSAASLTGGLTFGLAALSGNLSTLNIGDNVTFGGATVVQTNSNSVNTLTIASGKTLQLNSAVTVGTTGGTSNTKLTVTGASGTLAIGTVATPINANVQVGNATTDGQSNAATWDMSNLGTFYANLGNGTFRIGDPVNSGGGATGGSTLILATDSTITAATIRADSPDSAVTEAIKLGSGTNRFNVTTLNVGSQNGRSNGTLSFNTGTGTFTVRGLAGGAAVPDNTSRADLNVANNVFSTASNPTGSFDTTGHSADLRFGTMVIAGRNANNGFATGTFSFDAGTLDANDLTVGNKASGSSTTGTIGGTVTLTGGTSTFNASTSPIALGINASNTAGTGSGAFVVGGTASVTVAANGGNSFRLGNSTVAGGTAAGSITINGGTLTVAGDIIRGAATGTSTASLSLSGGTLDMGGRKIGGSVAASNLTSLTFASGTLRNVAEINNGAALTKTTGGTLTLDGTNAYTGDTGDLRRHPPARLQQRHSRWSGQGERLRDRHS